MDSLYLAGVVVLAVIAFVLVIVVSKYFMTWLRARVAVGQQTFSGPLWSRQL